MIYESSPDDYRYATRAPAVAQSKLWQAATLIRRHRLGVADDKCASRGSMQPEYGNVCAVDHAAST